MIGKERQKEVKSYITDETNQIYVQLVIHTISTLHRMYLLNQWRLVDIIVTSREPERKL